MNKSHIKRLCVFCGSKVGNLIAYKNIAIELANILYTSNISLVYGGAKVGLMGVLADQMLSKNGQVIGVMPKSLVDIEIAHPNLTDLQVVNSMHERKVRMAELSDGFIMLPGGPGSLDEFFEMFTLAQLGYHLKPCGILNPCGYYDYLLKFLDHAVDQGFLHDAHRHMILVDQCPTSMLNRLIHYDAAKETKFSTLLPVDVDTG